MRRLFVVVLVLAALVIPRPDSAGAAGADVCNTWGAETYGTPLSVTTPPGFVTVNITLNLMCVGLGFNVGLAATGTMFGGCAAESGTAVISTPGVTGTMAWARVGLHDFFVVDFSTGGTRYLYAAPTAWTPPGPLDCITPGVSSATLHMVGPLVGV